MRKNTNPPSKPEKGKGKTAPSTLGDTGHITDSDGYVRGKRGAFNEPTSTESYTSSVDQALSEATGKVQVKDIKPIARKHRLLKVEKPSLNPKAEFRKKIHFFTFGESNRSFFSLEIDGNYNEKILSAFKEFIAAHLDEYINSIEPKELKEESATLNIGGNTFSWTFEYTGGSQYLEEFKKSIFNEIDKHRLETESEPTTKADNPATKSKEPKKPQSIRDGINVDVLHQRISDDFDYTLQGLLAIYDDLESLRTKKKSQITSDAQRQLSDIVFKCLRMLNDRNFETKANKLYETAVSKGVKPLTIIRFLCDVGIPPSENILLDVMPSPSLKDKEQQPTERENMGEDIQLVIEFTDASDPVAIGVAIKAARTAAGLSQNQLVAKTNNAVSKSTLSTLESGKAKHVPQLSTLSAIGEATGFTMKMTYKK